MNRKITRILSVTAALTAVLAASAPVPADGHRRGGGTFATSSHGSSSANRHVGTTHSRDRARLGQGMRHDSRLGARRGHLHATPDWRFRGHVRFMTVLPPGCRTFRYGGTSYYYANDLYYTWSSSRHGYVVTDPPPVLEGNAPDVETAESKSADGADARRIHIYPRNGQSEEQTAADRFECHRWAVEQTGFDPTLGARQAEDAAGPSDYRRALIACLDRRGFSAN